MPRIMHTKKGRSRASLAIRPIRRTEEHKQRGDAADAMWREMKRRIAEKLR